MRDAFDGLTTVGSGSYAPDDVHFLLRAMDIDVTDVEEKERLIQTRQRHYSEMISQEHPPSDTQKAFTCRRWRKTAHAWPPMFRLWPWP